MEASLELDHHFNQNFEMKYFKKPTADTAGVYLDEEEFGMIHEESLTQHRTIIINNDPRKLGKYNNC